MKVLLPDNLGFVPCVAGAEILLFDPFAPLPVTHRDAQAIVVFETPADVLAGYARDLGRIEWVQSLGAGVDAMFGAGFRPGTLITSGRGLHDLPVAEHVLALLLAAARSLPRAIRAQIGHRWASELGGRQPFPDPTRFSTLLGAKVGIWGFGSIGRTLASRLTGLGSEPIGIVRDGSDPLPGTVPTARIGAVLPVLDALVLLLPGTPANRHIVDAGVLRALPPRAWVVNAGRGSVLDEAALIDALIGGRLAGAALDVFEEEPLGVNSPLWDLPNVILTPHAAGGRPVGAESLVTRNLQAYVAGRPLENLAGVL